MATWAGMLEKLVTRMVTRHDRCRGGVRGSCVRMGCACAAPEQRARGAVLPRERERTVSLRAQAPGRVRGVRGTVWSGRVYVRWCDVLCVIRMIVISPIAP